LLSIFGKNFGVESAPGTPLPTIAGGTCVTLNNQAIPLLYVTSTQINAQIPTTLAAGRYPLVVHSISALAASSSTTVTVSQYAPAVLMEGTQSAILHLDGSFVTRDHPANRDETLMIFATGLGPTHGAAVTTGQAAPSDPLAIITPSTVNVYFGTPSWVQASMIVDWVGLAPGAVGVYQINVTVPGFHISGSDLPVMIKVGSVTSQAAGPDVPSVAVN
jgi:uncharacterized protein (TIGR03437 family)